MTKHNYMGGVVPEIGQVWEQVVGEFVGRRVVIADEGPGGFTLDPYPGKCPCPRKQRRTHMNAYDFQRKFVFRKPRTTALKPSQDPNAAAEFPK